MIERSLTHRAPLAWAVVAWVAGAWVAHAGWIGLHRVAAQPWLAGVALIGLVMAWASAARPGRFMMAGLAVALVAAGALRTGQERARIEAWDELGLPPREARVTLEVERMFASGLRMAWSGVARVAEADGPAAELVGQRIHFTLAMSSDLPRVGRGTRVVAKGVVEPLAFVPPMDDFDRMLADEGINFALRRARSEGWAEPPRGWAAFCSRAGAAVERWLRAGLITQPERADLYVAMMLGKKEALTAERRDDFVRTGTMHLFAISGLHIAGIGAALHVVLVVARLPATARLLVGAGLLWIYVQITGAAPSAIRAFWMVTAVLAAREIRAPGNSLAALSACALGVLAWSPHQVFSAGFQLSYGIVTALLLYGVPLQERWLARWQPWSGLPAALRRGWREWVEDAGRGVIGVVALGLAATLVSLPAGVVFFGLLTPGGFWVNLVLVPVSALVLFAGVGAIATSAVGLEGLAMIFNHAAALVLAGMEAVVDAALRLPGLAWPARFEPTAWGPVVLVGLLAMLAAGYTDGWRARRGGFWAPWVVLAVVLVFTVRAVPEEAVPGHEKGDGPEAVAVGKPSLEVQLRE